MSLLIGRMEAPPRRLLQPLGRPASREPGPQTAAEPGMDPQATRPRRDFASAATNADRPGRRRCRDKNRGKYWALEGVSSLKIDIRADSRPATTFVSLGEQPRLEAAVIDQRRLDAAACGLASLVLLVGVGLTRRPRATRRRM